MAKEETLGRYTDAITMKYDLSLQGKKGRKRAV
jgi:hypothetical protein